MPQAQELQEPPINHIIIMSTQDPNSFPSSAPSAMPSQTTTTMSYGLPWWDEQWIACLTIILMLYCIASAVIWFAMWVFSMSNDRSERAPLNNPRVNYSISRRRRNQDIELLARTIWPQSDAHPNHLTNDSLYSMQRYDLEDEHGRLRRDLDRIGVT
ncbi:MAG: hypothetical protein M1827_005614 [Pycnora praestabilis]|nr:MAG: hypothetical protein M1827_005614 [Pycnora praestabilis]